MTTKADCVDSAAYALRKATEAVEKDVDAEPWLAIAAAWTVLARAAHWRAR